MLRPHYRIFIHLDKSPERNRQTDRETDGQSARGYYSGLHCEQTHRKNHNHQ